MYTTRTSEPQSPSSQITSIRLEKPTFSSPSGEPGRAWGVWRVEIINVSQCVGPVVGLIMKPPTWLGERWTDRFYGFWCREIFHLFVPRFKKSLINFPPPVTVCPDKNANSNSFFCGGLICEFVIFWQLIVFEWFFCPIWKFINPQQSGF